MYDWLFGQVASPRLAAIFDSVGQNLRYLRCRVVGLPVFVVGPVRVTVVHAHRIDLLFVTLDTTWCTNIVSEDPCFAALRATKHVVGEATREK